MDSNPQHRNRKAATGKLTDCGYVWAGGGDDNTTSPEIIAELRECGMHEYADQLERENQRNNFYLWDENWLAYEVFCASCDQWQFAGFGGIVGLNGMFVMGYIRDMLQLSGDDARQLYHDVRLIASGALKAWREKSDKK